MGFSQNYQRVPELPESEFSALADDVRAIIAVVQLDMDMTVTSYGPQGDDEPPCCNGDLISFVIPNSGMESFVLERVYRVEPDRNGKISEAVKTLTSYAPPELNIAADTLVVAVLIAAQERLAPALTFTTDYTDPQDLAPGIALFTKATGRIPTGRVSNWALPDLSDLPVVFEVTPLGRAYEKMQVPVVVGAGGYKAAATLAGEQAGAFLDDYGALLSCEENPAYTGWRVWTVRLGRVPGASLGKTYLVKMIG